MNLPPAHDFFHRRSRIKFCSACLTRRQSSPMKDFSQLLQSRFANRLRRFRRHAKHGNYRRAVSPLVPNLLFFCRDMFDGLRPPADSTSEGPVCRVTSRISGSNRWPNKFQLGSLHASAYIGTLTAWLMWIALSITWSNHASVRPAGRRKWRDKTEE